MAKNRPFTFVAAIIFLVVAILHLYRLVAGFDVVIAGRVVGQVPSIAGLVIGGLLSLMLFRESRN